MELNAVAEAPLSARAATVLFFQQPYRLRRRILAKFVPGMRFPEGTSERDRMLGALIRIRDQGQFIEFVRLVEATLRFLPAKNVG